MALILVVDVQARHNSVYHSEYVPLHRTPDLASARDICISLCEALPQLWVNRDQIKSKVSGLVDRAVQESTSSSLLATATATNHGGASVSRRRVRMNNRQQKEVPRRSVLEKTALAASLARKTAAKVATAALSTTSSSSDASIEQDEPTAEFAKFTNRQVQTTLVSRDSRENSLLLARLKVKKNRPLAPVKEEMTEDSNRVASLQCLTDPLIPQHVWDGLTGKEFTEHGELLDGLARTGLNLASQDESNDWIAWTKVTASFKESLEDGAIHVWTGQTRRSGPNNQVFYGASAPFIKTRSIVPMSPIELIELMLDSNRVKTYNQWSIGRSDLWKSEDERTKIVQNTNQIPMGKKPLQSTTLLHACPIGGAVGPDASWLLISRAIGPQPENKNVGTSDILLGVNMVQPLGEDKSVLTSITHVYSSAVPGMLAERLGVKSAVKFVNDLRGLGVPVSAE